MSYTRICPRDLFNEAKLLKCIGQISLLILDNQAPDNLKMKTDYDSFTVIQDTSYGSIYLEEILITISGHSHIFYCRMNAKDSYPLEVVANETEDFIEVFNDDGTFHSDFIDYCNELRLPF